MQKTATTEALTIDYKFNILQRLSAHTEAKRANIKLLVKIKSGTSQPTVERVIYAKWSDARKPNYDVLRAFADVFKVPVEELENPKP
jgi:hypothetical protein